MADAKIVVGGSTGGTNWQTALAFLNSLQEGTGTDTTVLDVLKYRAEIAKWASELIRQLITYIEEFSQVITYQNLPDFIWYGLSGKESTIQDKIMALSQGIADQTNPIIQGMLTVLEKQFVTEPPDFDVNGIIDIIEAQMKREYGTGATSVYGFRNIYYGFLSAILLENYFTIPTADQTQIDTTVNAFISRSKSNLDEQMFLVERRQLTQLADDWVLDSSIASDAISRTMARKGRQYTEIENQAEELRIQLLTQAWQRQINKATVRVQAIEQAPKEMTAGVVSVLGEAIAARFLNPQRFVDALPNVLSTSMQGLIDMMNTIQGDRHKHTDFNLDSFQRIIDAMNVIASNFSAQAAAVAKFATMEAS